ncbi:MULTISPECIES: hypothetical protein [unclassified Microcoleus]|uniref:hypothetical protein n=1 Tax=unclassified Microcoleus TaxID=2642155 RepID=UPI002FD0C2F3
MTVTDLRLWTVEEYRRRTQTGIFNPDEGVELIDGPIISVSEICWQDLLEFAFKIRLL